MTEHEQNLRDLAAMFAMAALLIRNKEYDYVHEKAFMIADAWMEHRNPKEEEGLAALKPKKK